MTKFMKTQLKKSDVLTNINKFSKFEIDRTINMPKLMIRAIRYRHTMVGPALFIEKLKIVFIFFY